MLTVPFILQWKQANVLADEEEEKNEERDELVSLRLLVEQ